MKRNFLGILGALLLVVGMGFVSSTPANAALTYNAENLNDGGGGGGSTSNVNNDDAGGCGGSFLGFKPWYQGLCSGGDIVAVCEKDGDCPNGSKKLNVFVWTAVLNVTFDLTLAVGYIAVAMVIYGGFMYMASQGDPNKAAKGKKTLTSAVIGIILTMGASVIVNTAKTILQINDSAGWQQNTAVSTQLVQDAFNWAYMAAGVVAVGFVIKSGFDYMMSAGDVSKARKATQGLIFSIVGLVVVLAASVITGFVIKSVGSSL